MKTKSELFTLINDRYPDNSTQFIKAVNLREVDTQVADSSLNLAETGLQTAAGVTNFFAGVQSKGSPVLFGGEVTEVLRGSSTVNQAPASLGVPTDISFGAAVSNALVSLSAAGVITFLQSGTYAVRVKMQMGRANNSGASIIATRMLKNGVQFGSPDVTIIENSAQIHVKESRVAITVNANDTIKFQLAREPQGVNFGGLVAFPMTGALASWGAAPSALVVIEQFQGDA